MLTKLQRVTIDSSSEAALILNRLRIDFPINELTESQWDILECIADPEKDVPLFDDRIIVTWRFGERVEYCSLNGVYLLVTRYLEIHPADRRIVPKKTVRVLSNVYPLEMYLKNYGLILKL